MAAFDWKKQIKSVADSAEFKANGGGNAKTPAQKVADTMTAALAAYKRGNKKDNGEALKRPTIVAKGGEVKFSVRFANKALELVPGITEAVVPTVAFEQTYNAIREDVVKGTYDEQLAPLAANAKERGKRGANSRAGKKK